MDIETPNQTPSTGPAASEPQADNRNWSFSLSGPGMEPFLAPIENPLTRVNDTKVRRLYLQATSQQWFGPQRINFEQPVELTEEQRRIWIKLIQIFYTLEKMGLNVIGRMTPAAVSKLKSDEIAYYLTAQAGDEARHVFLLENYLKKLGEPPTYQRMLHVLSIAASSGICKVENWLFSTLFSENFAHSFLRRAKSSQIDPIGSAICKNLQMDESRHLHFLHIVLPDLYDRLNLFGRSYMKLSQYFIMKFTEIISRSLTQDAAAVGIDRRDLIEEVFANVERSYAGFGVNPNFLPFPRITTTSH